MAEVQTSIVVSGVVSIFVNLLSITYQRRKQKESQINQEQEYWYREVVSLGRQIRRKSMELEYGVQLDPSSLATESGTSSDRELDAIHSLIDDLEAELDNAPPEIHSKEIASKIRGLIGWYRRPEIDDDGAFTSTDLKEGLIRHSEAVMDSAYEDSDRITTIPY